MQPWNAPLSGSSVLTFTSTNFGATDNSLTTFVGDPPCLATVWVSSTQLLCTTPVGGGQGLAVLARAKGTLVATADGLFSYDAPVVSSVSPRNLAPAGGTSVTISGLNLDATVNARIGLTSARTTQWLSTTALKCSSPATATDGSVVGVPVLSVLSFSDFTTVPHSFPLRFDDHCTPATSDQCGVCGGDGSSCVGCDGLPRSSPLSCPAPSVASVSLLCGYAGLRVLFDRDTDRGLLAAEEDCGELVTTWTHSLLGANPRCYWRRPNELVISFGVGWVLGKSTPFSFLSSVSVKQANGGSNMYLAAPSYTVAPPPSSCAPAPPPSLRAVVPSAATSCHAVVVDASAIAGNAGRPWLTVQWGLDVNASSVREDALSSVQAALASTTATTLDLNTWLLPSPPIAGQFTFTLRLVNFLGETFDTRAFVSLGAPSPSAFIVLPSPLLASVGGVLEASATRCGTASLLAFSWAITPTPPYFSSLPSSFFQRRVLAIPPRTLSASVNYTVSVTVTATDAQGAMVGAPFSASSPLRALPSRPVAVISGGDRLVDTASALPLVLNASLSLSVDADADGAPLPLQFRWQCSQQSTVGPALPEETCSSSLTQSFLPLAEVSVPSEALLPSFQYRFTVTVSTHNGTMSDSASVLCTTPAAGVPVLGVTLWPNKNLGRPVVVTDDALMVQTSFFGSHNVTAWQWSLSPWPSTPPFSPSPFSPSGVGSVSCTAVENAFYPSDVTCGLSSILISTHSLVPGRTYQLSFRAVDNSQGSGEVSLSFVAHTPPSAIGDPRLSPPSGVALSTLFEVTVAQVFVSEYLPLTFEFGYSYTLSEATTATIFLAEPQLLPWISRVRLGAAGPVTVFAIATDTLGGACVSKVDVSLTHQDASELQSLAAQLTQEASALATPDGGYFAASQLVGTVASALNTHRNLSLPNAASSRSDLLVVLEAVLPLRDTKNTAHLEALGQVFRQLVASPTQVSDAFMASVVSVCGTLVSAWSTFVVSPASNTTSISKRQTLLVSAVVTTISSLTSSTTTSATAAAATTTSTTASSSPTLMPRSRSLSTTAPVSSFHTTESTSPVAAPPLFFAEEPASRPPSPFAEEPTSRPPSPFAEEPTSRPPLPFAEEPTSRPPLPFAEEPASLSRPPSPFAEEATRSDPTSPPAVIQRPSTNARVVANSEARARALSVPTSARLVPDREAHTRAYHALSVPTAAVRRQWVEALLLQLDTVVAVSLAFSRQGDVATVDTPAVVVVGRRTTAADFKAWGSVRVIPSTAEPSVTFEADSFADVALAADLIVQTVLFRKNPWPGQVATGPPFRFYVRPFVTWGSPAQPKYTLTPASPFTVRHVVSPLADLTVKAFGLRRIDACVTLTSDDTWTPYECSWRGSDAATSIVTCQCPVFADFAIQDLPSDCTNLPLGSAVEDSCGMCNGFGRAQDSCGQCFGQNLLCNARGFCSTREPPSEARPCICPPNYGGVNCSECAANLFGPVCTLFCEAASTCNAHGACDSLARCVCGGNWDGQFCDRCAENYFGETCEVLCKPEYCRGHGTCSPVTTVCDCDTGYTGDYCDRCGTNYYSDTCSVYCVAAITCYGHGTCDRSTGKCVCESDWNPANSCANCRDTVCSGHGSCANDGTNRCVCTGNFVGGACDFCATDYTGPNCDVFCHSATSCSGHGTCDANGKCVCQGHFTGLSCSDCEPYWLNDDCNTYCEPAVTCSLRGSCLTTGGCTCPRQFSLPTCGSCSEGYFGPDCSVECNTNVCRAPRVCSGVGDCVCPDLRTGEFCELCVPNYYDASKSCSVRCVAEEESFQGCYGHGHCNSLGECQCIQDERGQHTGTNCELCLEHYYGPNCDILCWVGKTDCFSPNICQPGTGICGCPVGFTGANCAECAPNYYPIESCAIFCSNELSCTGHGSCIHDGTCRCNTNFQGEACNSCVANYYAFYCNLYCEAQTTCSGQGYCLSGYCACDVPFQGETCSDCMAEYFGTSCERYCGSGTCGGRGECSSLGFCECYANFLGDNCEFCSHGRFGPACEIRCDARDECSGHGTCNSKGRCVCVDRYVGPNCNICDATYYGSTCSRQCTDLLCNLHGRCNERGECECLEGWAGTFCDQCNAHWFSHDCSHFCSPQETCQGHGYCDVTGTCVCSGNFAKGVGPCSGCRPLFYGADCSRECDSVKTCYGHGTCDGNGFCVCQDKYAPPNCRSCVPDYYGIGCVIHCVAETTCGGHGWCDSLHGTCQCFDQFTGNVCQLCAEFYYGDGCERHCQPEFECAGHGACRYAPDHATCECYPGWLGSYCNCTREVCNNRADCNAAGVCECPSHWIGQTCAVCDPQYWGPNCEHLCECNGHAYTCDDDGYCFCDYGFAGKNCERCDVEFYAYPTCRLCYPPWTCNGHGSCDPLGNCVCPPPFYGEACGKYCVANVSCSGHGVCHPVTGLCLCDDLWAGGACEFGTRAPTPAPTRVRIVEAVVNYTVAGSIDEFASPAAQQLFVLELSKVLGVSRFRMHVRNVFAASVILEIEIFAPLTSAETSTHSLFRAMLAHGVSVTSIGPYRLVAAVAFSADFVRPSPAPEPTAVPEDSGLQLALGLGVGIPVGLIVLVVGYMFWRKRTYTEALHDAPLHLNDEFKRTPTYEYSVASLVPRVVSDDPNSNARFSAGYGRGGGYIHGASAVGDPHGPYAVADEDGDHVSVRSQEEHHSGSGSSYGDGVEFAQLGSSFSPADDPPTPALSGLSAADADADDAADIYSVPDVPCILRHTGLSKGTGKDTHAANGHVAADAREPDARHVVDAEPLVRGHRQASAGGDTTDGGLLAGGGARLASARGDGIEGRVLSGGHRQAERGGAAVRERQQLLVHVQHSAQQEFGDEEEFSRQEDDDDEDEYGEEQQSGGGGEGNRDHGRGVVDGRGHLGARGRASLHVNAQV